MTNFKEGDHFAGLYYDAKMDPRERMIWGEILIVDPKWKEVCLDLISWDGAHLSSITWSFNTLRKCQVHKITKDQYECARSLVSVKG